MKKLLFALIFAVMISAVLDTRSLYAQNSQVIVADVPFAFTTSNGTLPAGTYRIEPVGDSRSMWRIRGSHSQADEFLLAIIRVGTSNGDERLTFHRYGNKNFLAGFNTASYQIQLPASKSEKTQRSAEGPLARMEVIGLDTVTTETRR